MANDEAFDVSRLEGPPPSASGRLRARAEAAPVVRKRVDGPLDVDVAGHAGGAPVDPSSPRFREAALAAYYRADDDTPALRAAPPWTRSLFLLTASFVVAAVVLAFCGHAEITTKGRGILRADGGVQTVSVLGAGAVSDLRVKSGDVVRRGDVLLALDSAAVKSDLLEADRRLALATARKKDFDQKRRALYQTRRGLLVRRQEILRARLEVQEEALARLGGKVARAGALLDAGLATPNERDTASDERSQAMQTSLSIREEIAQVEGQVSTLEADLDLEAWTLTGEVSAAQAKRDALAFAMSQTTVVAPQDGRLEAVLVRRGDTLSPGAAVGRLVPAGAAVEVVSFVPERDRAFLEVGSRARIELDRLPVSEFGALEGTVTRIGSDLVSSAELRDALGDRAEIAEPMVRVEVALGPDARARDLGPYLRAGSMLDVRYTLRRRRIATLVLEPLRRWLRDP